MKLHEPETELEDDEEWVEYIPVRGELELTEADYVGAYTSYAVQRQHVGSVRGVLGLVLLSIAAGVVIGWLPTPGLWIPLAAVSLAGIALARWQWARTGRRVYAHLPEGSRRCRVAIDHETIRWRTDGLSYRYEWPLVVGWHETDDLIVLHHLGSTEAIDVLPKRAFSDDDLASLRELIEDCVEVAESTRPAVTDANRGSSWRTLLPLVLLIALVMAIYQLVTR